MATKTFPDIEIMPSLAPGPPPDDTAPVVLTEVTKRYGRRRSAVAALDRVSLSFAGGSFTAVLGVSGSGKSTLLQCAAGVLSVPRPARCGCAGRT